MSNYAIETFELGRSFGSVVAVETLSLRVPQGSIYGFLGPNGAGKTTTIRMLLGLIRPDSGEVYLCNVPLAQHRLTALRQVGALVDSPSLYPHLTGRENLEITRRLVQARPSQLNHVLMVVGLTGAAHRLVRGYSLGMRQRLGLALALLNEPQLLILDEPTNGLDPAGIHEMRDLLRSLATEYGITVFLSSHLLSEVEQIATDIAIITAGQLHFQGSFAELQAQQPERLVIGVRQPEAARHVLAAAGWQVEVSNGDQLTILGGATAIAAEVNARLVHAGIDVFCLYQDRSSLEQVFLSITQSALLEGNGQ